MLIFILLIHHLIMFIYPILICFDPIWCVGTNSYHLLHLFSKSYLLHLHCIFNSCSLLHYVYQWNEINPSHKVSAHVNDPCLLKSFQTQRVEWLREKKIDREIRRKIDRLRTKHYPPPPPPPSKSFFSWALTGETEGKKGMTDEYFLVREREVQEEKGRDGLS